MVIRWSFEAKKDYHNSLDYWEEHNGSFEYSSKIIKKIKRLYRLNTIIKRTRTSLR